MTDENNSAGWATEESQEDLTDDFLYYFYKGGEMLSKGRLREAGEHLERAAEIRPDNPRCQNLLGLVFFKQGDFARSIDIYRGLVERFNDDATLRVNLAMVLLKANLLQEAREELEQAIEMEPDNQKACRTMAVVLVKQDDQDLAKVYLARAGIEDPDRFVSSPPADDEEQQPEPAGQAVVPQPESAAAPGTPLPAGEPMETSSSESIFSEGPAMQPVAKSPPDEEMPEETSPPALAEEPQEETSPPAPIEEPPEETSPPAPAEESAIKVIAPLATEVTFKMVGPALETSLKGRLYTRLRDLVWMEGDLSFTKVRKQFDGEATKYLFGKGHKAMIKVEGKGALHFRPEPGSSGQGEFQVYDQKDQPAYFLEDYVHSFCGVDSWENGRLAFKQETSLPIFHLQGPAQVVLICPGAVERRSLTHRERFLLDVRRLVGWSGDLIPSLAKLGRPLPDGLWLELSGTGEVYYLTEPNLR